METWSYFPVRVCVLGVKCRAGFGRRWLFDGGTIGNRVKSGKFGTFKVLLAQNKREKKFFSESQGENNHPQKRYGAAACVSGEESQELGIQAQEDAPVPAGSVPPLHL